MLSDLKVLIIDDDEDDYFITSQYLEEIETINVSCNWSYNIKDAQEKLASNSYDLYFLDYRLGAKTGLELLIEAKQNGAYKPVILLTGKGTREIDKLAVENGAYDYLIKSELNSEKLERCLRYAIERYKSFKLLNDNERKYRLIFENALSFIFTCDKLLHFSDCNPASEYLLGYSPQELQGTSFFTLLEENDQKIVKDLVLAKKNITNLNLKLHTRHGEIKTGNVSLTYFDAEDVEPYWQGIIYDETMRAQAELEKIQSEKLEATYRLVRTLAHEIRNPLTNIGLSIEGLMEKGMDENQVTFIDIIKRGSRRINDIISELLNSAKTIDLKPEQVDLNELINEVLDIAQDRIGLKNIGTSISLLSQPVIKTLDREKFKIAILNLVVNAIEAMDKADSLLTVSLTQNADHTVLLIKDNGSGMDDTQLRKLFEPYFTTKKTGMGLGLVSTLNIIKSHKALIEVDSKPLLGTVFRVIFPEPVA
jgi:PAS domain S-box-containing protein